MKFLVPLLSLLLAIYCFLCVVDGGREWRHPQVHTAHVNITNMSKAIDSTAGVGKAIHPHKLHFAADEKCEEEEEEEEEEHEEECEECDEEEHEHEHEHEEECEECEEEEHEHHECEECEEEKLVLGHGLAGHQVLFNGQPKDLHKNNVPLKKVP